MILRELLLINRFNFLLHFVSKLSSFVFFFVRVLSCFIPVRKWRRLIRYFMQEKLTYPIKKKIIFNNYSLVEARLARKKKIRVMFLVSENQKWNCDFLYQEFEKDDRFEPVVALLGMHTEKAEKYRDSLQSNIDFFNKKKLNYVLAYDLNSDTFIDLKVFSPDIIFYQQPWSIIDNLHSLWYTSRFALACYVPYFLLVCNNYWHHDNLFGRCVWRFFVDFSHNEKYLLTLFKEPNHDRLKLSGHPKLDYYSDHRQKKTKARKKIIYAPHHSFEQHSNSLKYATYEWSGDIMLEFVHNHPEFDFVLKPHPRFKHALIINNIRTEDEIRCYFNAWEKLDNGFICDEGDYFDLFCQSDVLITDCASFIVEYLFTGNPVILLANKNSLEYNALGKMIVENYYQAGGVKKFEHYLQKIVLDGDDPLLLQRKSCAASLRVVGQSSSQYIRDHLISCLHYKCEIPFFLPDER